jgi:diacylglycerol kinase family enzyme
VSTVELILNLQAHDTRLDPAVATQLAGIIGRDGRVTATHSLDELPRVCDDIAATCPETIAICGGDGTLHQTLTAMIASYGARPLPRIAILRGGAMNNVADALGIRGDTTELLRRLLGRRDVVTIEQPVLRVGDRYGFFFGAGIVHGFLTAYYATGRPSPATAVRVLLRAAASGLVRGALAARMSRPIDATVVADGTRWRRSRFLALCASTTEHVGLGFQPFPRCREREDSFAVLGIATTFLGLLRRLPRIRAGRPLSGAGIVDDLACELAIDPDTPFGYTIDGDLYVATRPLTIARGPTLTVIRD